MGDRVSFLAYGDFGYSGPHNVVADDGSFRSVSFGVSELRIRDSGVMLGVPSWELVSIDPVEDPVEGSATTPKP